MHAGFRDDMTDSVPDENLNCNLRIVFFSVCGVLSRLFWTHLISLSAKDMMLASSSLRAFS